MFLCFFIYTMKVNGVWNCLVKSQWSSMSFGFGTHWLSLYGQKQFIKKNQKKKVNKSGTTWGWVNGNIYIFWEDCPFSISATSFVLPVHSHDCFFLFNLFILIFTWPWWLDADGPASLFGPPQHQDAFLLLRVHSTPASSAVKWQALNPSRPG